MKAEAKKILEETLEYNHCGNIIDLDGRVGNAILKAMDIYLKSKVEAISDEINKIDEILNSFIMDDVLIDEDLQRVGVARNIIHNLFEQLLKQ